MSKPKLIAMYLPQYHCIPENDAFWGKGFTDWVTVKNAKSLFKNHDQPKVPLNNNYYDLSIEEDVIWQSELANEYGIDGFGVYHYWFNNETNILTRPAEIIRDNPNVRINYFLAWDNANWKRSWSNVQGNAWTPSYDSKVKDKSGPSILIPYIIGGVEDWKIHYKSLFSHFNSPKYIKIDNKPVFIIFNFDENIDKMCKVWNEMAISDGFNGIYFIIKKKHTDNFNESDYHQFKYEPLFSGWSKQSFGRALLGKFKKLLKLSPVLKRYNYDFIWKNIINNAENDKNSTIYHGAFVDYDDTPRRGINGVYVGGATPEKFKKYLKQLINISSKQNKDFIFITAWNEWGEGAYLEPDNNMKLSFLESIRDLRKDI